MAVILSTKNTGQLSADQHRALTFATSQYEDYVINNFGNELQCTQNGSSITVSTGMCVLQGTVVQNNASIPLTFSQTGNGTAYVIVSVNLTTGNASISIKYTALTKADLILNPAGTRDMELYKITYTNGVITGFSSVRIILGKAYNPVDLIPVKTAGGFYAPVDFNLYKPSGNQTIETGPETLDVANKLCGNIAPNLNQLSLPKGFLYVVEANLESQINGINFFFGSYNGSAFIEYPTGAKGWAVPGSIGNTFSGKGCHYIVDLTSATSNFPGLFYGNGVPDTSVMTTKSLFSITQYLKVTLSNL